MKCKMYKPVKPSFLGKKILNHIDPLPVVQRIDWHYLFLAWKINGKYEGLETLCDCEACKVKWLSKFSLEEQLKAQEAYNLLRDAKEILRIGFEEKRFDLSAMVFFSEANGNDEGIFLLENGMKKFFLPMLRQQNPGERTDCFVSLADFIAPSDDYIGIFALTVHGADQWAEELHQKGDDYQSLLVKSVADRLAEATSVWLHEKIGEEFWGYAPITHAKGIRPAFGYPSIPDLSMLFEADKILNLSEIGIQLTENGAMKPNASICALHIAHPKAFYFMVGQIGVDQKKSYAQHRNMTVEELERWLV